MASKSKNEQKSARIKAKANEIKAKGKQKAEDIKDKRKKRIVKVKNLKADVQSNTVKDNRLELLVTIVNRGKGEYYADLLQSFDVNMQFIALGHGTADAKMLARFGLTDSDKTVIFGVIQGNKIKDAMSVLEQKFKTIKNGNGIAYTVPLSGVIGTLIFGFLSNNKMAVKNDTGDVK